MDCLRLLYGRRLVRTRESTPSQIRNHFSDALLFPLRPFPGGLKHVIGNIECRPMGGQIAARIRQQPNLTAE